MTRSGLPALDPQLDLAFERIVDVPRELVWRAWTTPVILMKWLTPAPWTTIACDIDLRPGGRFGSTMRSPEGQEFPNVGCYLEIIENERLVWTNGRANDTNRWASTSAGARRSINWWPQSVRRA